MRCGIILAGGKSLRMRASDENITDKALLIWRGKRLIDHAVDRFEAQLDQIHIAGPQNYGLANGNIPDLPNSFGGPIGGLWSCAKWFAANIPDVKGFYTAPVDTPLMPDDIVIKLTQSGKNAVAASPSGIQPAFAYWNIENLIGFLEITDENSLSLQSLAKRLEAEIIHFDNEDAFLNLNAVEDISNIKAISEMDL